MFQRRKFPRVSENYRISYMLIDQEQFQNNPLNSLALNISGGGLCFEAKEALVKDALVALEINSDGFSSAILALARVAWCKQKGDTYEVGAEFWWIGWRDNQAQTSMADFIASKTTAQRALA